MNYGFIIDNRKCIGCHACSTACKAENEVPLGVNRTWVKYVEVGEYPDVRRNFQVTRCNHCANPPCVRICPVTAMYQRADGIVEFDSDSCIGCKACMQACPYDAIYIDPDSHTAAKCHYCAHRTEIGLEPACVVVCPEHAIIAGDLDDANSEISRLLAAEQVTVRKPEQGTAPKLFYIEGNEFALHPTSTSASGRASKPAETYLWSDVIPQQNDALRLWDLLPAPEQVAVSDGSNSADSPPVSSQTGPHGVALRPIQEQGVAAQGPIYMGQGRMAEQMVQVSYNAQHMAPWGWPVPAYLVTKAIGSGLFLLMAGVFGLGFTVFEPGVALLIGFFSLLFTALTTGLLVFDLERPERFHYILLRPQWKSWLTRGAFILLGFSLVAGLWWLAELGAFLHWWSVDAVAAVRPAVWLAGAPLAVGVAVYTAFLFGQAEGRDLWQSSLLPFHLLIQAILAGCAFLLILRMGLVLPVALEQAAFWGLGIALLLNLFAIFSGELGMPHASDGAAQAAHIIQQGEFARFFRLIVVGVGHAIPGFLLLLPWSPATALAGLLAIVGLFAYEYVYVIAPQRIPNS